MAPAYRLKSGGLVGVLAVQGSFSLHLRALERLGAPAKAVRARADLEGCERLIIPGGESTVMSKFLEETGLDAEIRRRASAGELALFGTCAGAILLGHEPGPEPGAPLDAGRQPARLGLADVAVRRNAYGRQIQSFCGPVRAEGELAGEGELEGVFIRAPRLKPRSPRVAILGRSGDEPVLVRDGRFLLATFHPELTHDLRIHGYFVERM